MQHPWEGEAHRSLHVLRLRERINQVIAAQISSLLCLNNAPPFRYYKS